MTPNLIVCFTQKAFQLLYYYSISMVKRFIVPQRIGDSKLQFTLIFASETR